MIISFAGTEVSKQRYWCWLNNAIFAAKLSKLLYWKQDWVVLVLALYSGDLILPNSSLNCYSKSIFLITHNYCSALQTWLCALRRTDTFQCAPKHASFNCTFLVDFTAHEILWLLHQNLKWFKCTLYLFA